jgi:hypothetical protein
VQRFRNGQPLGEETQLPMDRISAVELYAGETLGGYAIRKVKAVLLFVAGLGFLTFLAVFLFGLDWYQPGRIPASVSFVGVGMEHADSAYVPLSCRNELATLERFLLANTRLRVLRKSNAGALGSALQVVGLLLAFLGLSFAVWSAQPIRELRTLKMVAAIPRSGEFGQEFPHLARTLRAIGVDLYAPGAPAPAYLESKIRQHCYMNIGIGAVAILLGITGGVTGKSPAWQEIRRSGT